MLGAVVVLCLFSQLAAFGYDSDGIENIIVDVAPSPVPTHLFNLRNERSYVISFEGNHFLRRSSARYAVLPNSFDSSETCASLTPNSKANYFSLKASTITRLNPENTVSISQGIHHPLGHSVCLSLNDGLDWYLVGSIPVPCFDTIKLFACFVAVYLVIARAFNDPDGAVTQAFLSGFLTYVIVFFDGCIPPLLVLVVAVAITWFARYIIKEPSTGICTFAFGGMAFWYATLVLPTSDRNDVHAAVGLFRDWLGCGLCWSLCRLGGPYVGKLVADRATKHVQPTSLNEVYGWVSFSVIFLYQLFRNKLSYAELAGLVLVTAGVGKVLKELLDVDHSAAETAETPNTETPAPTQPPATTAPAQPSPAQPQQTQPLFSTPPTTQTSVLSASPQPARGVQQMDSPLSQYTGPAEVHDGPSPSRTTPTYSYEEPPQTQAETPVTETPVAQSPSQGDEEMVDADPSPKRTTGNKRERTEDDVRKPSKAQRTRSSSSEKVGRRTSKRT